MPWDEEGTDYDEPKPAGGDSHEDEFDDEYGEQRPHGDPNRPDNAMEDAHQADIDYWEEIARLNAMAKPFDPGGPFASDAAALNPQARPFDRASRSSPMPPLSARSPTNSKTAAPFRCLPS